jgi:hypothetical protein
MAPTDWVKSMEGPLIPMSEAGVLSNSQRGADVGFFVITTLAAELNLLKATTISRAASLAQVSKPVTNIQTVPYELGGETYTAKIVTGSSAQSVSVIGRNMDDAVLPIASNIQKTLGVDVKVSTFSADELTGLKGGMLKRFNAAQEEINAIVENLGRRLTPAEYQATTMFELNKEWISSQKAAGSTIIDLGINTATSPGVGAYEMETGIVYGSTK